MQISKRSEKRYETLVKLFDESEGKPILMVSENIEEGEKVIKFEISKIGDEVIISHNGDDIISATEELTKFGNKIDDINKAIGKKLFQQLIIGRDIAGRENLTLLRQNIEKLASTELESLKLFLEE